MALNVGNTNIRNVYVNGVRVSKVFVNGVSVLSNPITYVGGGATPIVADSLATINVSNIGIEEGDVIIAGTSNGNHTGSPIPNAPSGFTSLFAAAGGGNDRNALLRVSYKVATGNENILSVSGNYNLSGGGFVIQVFRNVDTSNILDTPLVGLSGNTSTNNVNPLPITTVSDGAMAVAIGCCYTVAPTTGSFYSSDLYNMQDASYSHSQEVGGDIGYQYYYGSTCGIASKPIDNGGTYIDPSPWTYSGYLGGQNHMVCTLALKPK